MCSITELSNSIKELSNSIEELSYSIGELSNSIKAKNKISPVSCLPTDPKAFY